MSLTDTVIDRFAIDVITDANVDTRVDRFVVVGVSSPDVGTTDCHVDRIAVLCISANHPYVPPVDLTNSALVDRFVVDIVTTSVQPVKVDRITVISLWSQHPYVPPPLPDGALLDRFAIDTVTLSAPDTRVDRIAIDAVSIPNPDTRINRMTVVAVSQPLGPEIKMDRFVIMVISGKRHLSGSMFVPRHPRFRR